MTRNMWGKENRMTHTTRQPSVRSLVTFPLNLSMWVDEDARWTFSNGAAGGGIALETQLRL